MTTIVVKVQDLLDAGLRVDFRRVRPGAPTTVMVHSKQGIVEYVCFFADQGLTEVFTTEPANLSWARRFLDANEVHFEVRP